jgi:mycothione reductase
VSQTLKKKILSITSDKPIQLAVDENKNAEKFDLIVIGSGSGLDVANATFQHGLRVAIIEKDRMGGTCLNRGCIPSKLLIHSADVAETIKRAHIFGIKVDGFTVDFQGMVDRVNNITDSSSQQIKNAFGGIENPKLFSDVCKFVGEKTLSLGENKTNNKKILTADKILIAAGTRPRIPNIHGLENSGYLTSDEIFRIKKQPKTLTIIGGGYIACEIAHFFGALGTEVNIIQRRDVLIPDEDEEVSQKFTEIFSKKYNVYLGYKAKSVSKDTDGNGGSKFHITATKNDNTSTKTINIVSEQLLIAAGRIPNSDTLDLHKTGVSVNDKGYIVTDKYLETKVKGIFAIGDIVGRYLFKHNANNEAQYAYYNIIASSTEKIPVNYYAMPHAIFSSPQVAGVGLREQDLKNMSIDYYKSVYPYIKTAMGEAIEDRDGFVKFLVNKADKKILGCHIIGTEASTLIHEVLVAMRYGHGRIESISGTIHIHPALSEVVARAAGHKE